MMFARYLGDWFSNWFGDSEDEIPPEETGGNGGGSGTANPFDAWGRQQVSYPTYFQTQRPRLSQRDLVVAAVASGCI